MHRITKSEPVTRAVAVYEYAGDIAKPTAARLIPVSLFIGGHYEDAGSYLARPIPFAIEPDTIYELQRGGDTLGTLNLAFAKNLRGSSAEVTVPFDEAWFGYGRFSPVKAAPATPAKKAGHTQKAYAVQDDGKPHFGSKPDAPANSSRDRRDTTDVDPDADRAEKVSLPDDRDPSAPNPDRPTLRRRPEDTTGGPKTKRPKETASVTAAGAGPDKDPDRPTIKRKAGGSTNDDIAPDPSEVSSTKSTHGAAGTVSAASASQNGVLTDNGRPELRRNTGASADNLAKSQATAIPDLAKVAAPGLPADLNLAVAISDMQDRTSHSYATPFTSDAERAAAMAEMRALGMEVLAKPALATDALSAGTGANIVKPASATTAQTAPRSTARTANRATTRRPAVKPPVAEAENASPSTPRNEQLAAYTLYYGAPLTYVYTAQAGSAPVRFVTIVAQRNLDGKLDIGLRSVTDSAHLDRVPRYRLVDAVDADASNRASLLFELRNSSSRQFALYRFLGPRPDQVFETATVK